MRPVWFLVVAVLLGLSAQTKTAYADEVAPDLEPADLRVKAQAELKKLVSAMPANDQKRLVGIYAAFDATESDPIAQVACDDDGDYVVLLSDAMLRLLTYIARAESHDEPNGSRKIEEYAAFLVRTQIPGRRLLPPPAGFYVAERPAASYEDRFADALSFVVARELAHLRTGDLVCRKPTATKESGDETWTSAERRNASELAATLYPGRQVERDTEAIHRLLESGRTEKGALALLRFFAQFEVERVVAVGRFAPTYLGHHPASLMRATSVKRAVEAYKRGGD